MDTNHKITSPAIDTVFDGLPVHLGASTITHLKLFIKHFLLDMQTVDNPEYWTWGVVTLKDLACSTGIHFSYGGDDTIPEHIDHNQIYVHL